MDFVAFYSKHLEQFGCFKRIVALVIYHGVCDGPRGVAVVGVPANRDTHSKRG